MGAKLSESMSQDELRGKVLRAVHELSRGIPGKPVELRRVAQVADLEPDNPDDAERCINAVQYLGGRNWLEKETLGWEALHITKEGVDEVVGRSPQAASSTSIVINAPVHGSVIGTHNTAELTNNFDFRSIEQRIESEGGEDAGELREALAKIERLLKEEETLDRGALARFSAVMQRHGWFTGAVAEAVLGFATQGGS
jgi:hypothetical protein